MVSFRTVRPTTLTMNKNLTQNFTKIVRIPENLPPMLTFEETAYTWEMETLEKEITGVKFTYTTGFSKNENKITAVLEMAENGDPSLFNKVLPAVISDNQSLESALNPEKANLSANTNVGYTSLQLFINPTSGQTVKITWEFEKSTLGDNINKNYSRLAKYPTSVLKLLYGIPSLVVDLFKG